MTFLSFIDGDVMRYYAQSISLEIGILGFQVTLHLISGGDLVLCFLLSGPQFLGLLNGDNSPCPGAL